MNTRQFIFLGAVGAIGFVLAFVLGSFVNAATGIPLTGGLLNAIIVGVVLTVGMKAVPRFGAGMTIWIVFSILAIPTITMGPPGIYKVAVGIVGGFIWDVAVSALRRKNAGYIVGGAVGSDAIILGTLGAMVVFGLPGVEKLQGALLMLLAIYTVMGLLSGWLGVLLYNKKLSKLGVFQRLCGDHA